MGFTPGKTKKELRSELEKMTQDFLARGGEVLECQRGASGRDINEPLPAPPIEKSQQTRTPVNHIVETLERRKQPKNKLKPLKKSRPKKILITDDFGEPVRWIWSDPNNNPSPK